MPVAHDWVPLFIKLRKDSPLSLPMAAGHCPLLRGTTQLTAENSLPLNGLLQDYLCGSRFYVITDSNPLTYLVTSAKLSPTDCHWLSSLAVFDFKISYRCGKAHGNPDGLSCIPVSGGEGNQDVLSDKQYVRSFLYHLKPLQGDGFACSHESFQATCQAYSVDELGDESAELPAVEVVGDRPEAVDNDLLADQTLHDLSFKIMTLGRVQMLGYSVTDENLLPQEFGDHRSFLVSGKECP